MNIILDTDSYKTSHYLQYPSNVTGMFSYIESRGGEYKETVFFGLQYILKKYLSKPITEVDILEARMFYEQHGVPFNKEGWEYIISKYNGYLPITINAVPEGSIIPTNNVLMTISCNDPKCFWLVSYLETILLRVWYPTTVATISRHIKVIINTYMHATSDSPSEIDFKLHDFGSRGVSSSESAMIGGMAHLVNFKGSDTVIAIRGAREFYKCDMAGFSIPAAEHSTVTSWGEENEDLFFSHMIETFGKKYPFIACVSDSYDLNNAINSWVKIKDKIIKSGSVLVVRPDSGDPVKIVSETVSKLAKGFGSLKNSKGYKVLHPSIRVIQGDGINERSIEAILTELESKGFSADNINFGMGGALLQHMNRDTMKFAMKCSAIRKDGQWFGVNKNPKTDPGKASKKGVLNLYTDKNGKYVTKAINHSWSDNVIEENLSDYRSVMRTVFSYGKLLEDDSLETIRARAWEK